MTSAGSTGHDKGQGLIWRIQVTPGEKICRQGHHAALRKLHALVDDTWKEKVKALDGDVEVAVDERVDAVSDVQLDEVTHALGAGVDVLENFPV